MIPSVFVSSTIQDLHHLRDAIREAVSDLAYAPVMSEYGDVGYLPTSSAQDSCYASLRQCQLAIVIIGKRYGSLAANGLSVTHNEFRAARENGIPVICLADQEVFAYKPVFDANSGSIVIPAMDQPERTFAFIQEVMDSQVNNGVVPYTTVSSARIQLKLQIAHFVGELLRRKLDPTTGEIKDILSEIKTLRHELVATPERESLRFIRAVRFLLEDQCDDLRNVLQSLCGSLENGVPVLLESDSIATFVLKATKKAPELIEATTVIELEEYLHSHEREFFFSSRLQGMVPPDPAVSFFAVRIGGTAFVANRSGLDRIEQSFSRFLRALELTGRGDR